uniref:Uncharacterized protein n=1 Tax=Octopus bimaculoides TaxID=37653 RepID=A0A0L8G5U8_OCTBM
MQCINEMTTVMTTVQETGITRCKSLECLFSLKGKKMYECTSVCVREKTQNK